MQSQRRKKLAAFLTLWETFNFLELWNKAEGKVCQEFNACAQDGSLGQNYPKLCVTERERIQEQKDFLQMCVQRLEFHATWEKADEMMCETFWTQLFPCKFSGESLVDLYRQTCPLLALCSVVRFV